MTLQVEARRRLAEEAAAAVRALREAIERAKQHMTASASAALVPGSGDPAAQPSTSPVLEQQPPTDAAAGEAGAADVAAQPVEAAAAVAKDVAEAGAVAVATETAVAEVEGADVSLDEEAIRKATIALLMGDEGHEEGAAAVLPDVATQQAVGVQDEEGDACLSDDAYGSSVVPEVDAEAAEAEREEAAEAAARARLSEGVLPVLATTQPVTRLHPDPDQVSTVGAAAAVWGSNQGAADQGQDGGSAAVQAVHVSSTGGTGSTVYPSEMLASPEMWTPSEEEIVDTLAAALEVVQFLEENGDTENGAMQVVMAGSGGLNRLGQAEGLPSVAPPGHGAGGKLSRVTVAVQERLRPR